MDQDDYWNVSHSKSFCFDDLDEIEEQSADDNISEISTQSSISLGAIINENDLQLIWQTGKLYADKAKQISAGKKNVWTNDFITKMENAFDCVWEKDSINNDS